MKNSVQKIVWIALLMLLAPKGIRAQQDPMFTQYMFNEMAINPAYAGSFEALNLQALYRLQWLGIEGAPRTLTLSAHAPISGRNMGWGINLMSDRVGPLNYSMFYGNYAYQIILNSGTLALGIKAGLGMYSAELGNLHPKDKNDPTLVNFRRKVMPNVGIGIFYYNQKGYFGFSMPKLVKSHINVGRNEFGEVRHHYFLMGGYLWNVGRYRNYVLKTSFMMRGAVGAPISLDLSGVLYLYEKLGLGLTYRHGAALTGIIQYYFTDNFYMGFAYDYATTELRYVNNGTFEVLLSYNIKNRSYTRIYSPRFF